MSYPYLMSAPLNAEWLAWIVRTPQKFAFMIKKWQREECDGKNISTNPAKGGTDGKQERGVQEEATNMMGDLEKLRKNKKEREKARACIFLYSLCTLGNQFFINPSV